MYGPRTVPLLALVTALCVAPAGAAASGPRQADSAARTPLESSPIDTVVVVLLENHSFDNVLGPWCQRTRRCRGVDVGDRVRLADGALHPLRRASDFVAGLGHARRDQDLAWHDGANDGWNFVRNCGKALGEACLSLYEPDQVPNITALAARFAVSDATSTCERVPTWADHVQWFTGCELGGFTGDEVPHKIADRPRPGGVGWGCDSSSVAEWGPPDARRMVPSCFPDYGIRRSVLPPGWDPAAGGAYKATPVRPRRTLGDICASTRGCTWGLYGSTREQWSRTLATGELDHAYLYNIASNFAQHAFPVAREHTRSADLFVPDAAAGTLPAITFLLPGVSRGANSQHNKTSMALGDDVLGEQVAAFVHGPQYSHAAMFITYDDCGCFYDHISPNRVPLVIVSPWVRPRSTDPHPTTFAGVVHFIDDALGLEHVSRQVAAAYAYSDSFDYSTPPRLGGPLPVVQGVPALSVLSMAAVPVVETWDDEVS